MHFACEWISCNINCHYIFAVGNEYNVWVLLVVSCLKTRLNISYISIVVLPAAQALFLEICFSDEMQVTESDIEMCGNYLVILPYHHLAEEFYPS